MAKHKSNKKKQQGAPQLTMNNYVKTKAAKLPWGKCYITETWKEVGMANVLMVRQMGGSKLLVGFYLIDIFCLGVKDTYCKWRLEEDELQEWLTYLQEHDQAMVEKSPDLLQNIIYGAVEYAESIGISPHKDFSITEYILDPADEIPFIEIEFGKEGKPFYYAGPHDNAQLIIEKLTKKLGPDNFHAVIPIGNIMDDDDDYYYDDDDNDDDNDIEDIDNIDVTNQPKD
ncbi:MAG TPA: hypothetical protein PK239_02320 [Chitinophagales bacterium]|nr:hypothetical protein [Chitinophagales bacterium]HRK26103.1 hypothetical protein [Chitinophagales bacterium]